MTDNILPFRDPSKPYDEAKAAVAFNRYAALMKAWRTDPSLMDEECFQILCHDAKSQFEAHFGVSA